MSGPHPDHLRHSFAPNPFHLLKRQLGVNQIEGAVGKRQGRRIALLKIDPSVSRIIDDREW
jgi:hypothetical protein